MRVVLADDQVLLRVSLAEALAARGVEVVGQAGDGASGVAMAMALPPDVVIVDIRMPPTHTLEGLDAAAEIRRRLPGTGILVLSHHVVTAIAVDLLRDDPRGVGYLLKDRITRMDDCVDALERLAAGGSVVDPDIVSRLLGRPRAGGPLDALTPREREVLAAMAEGRSNVGIARALAHRGEDGRAPRLADPWQAGHRAGGRQSPPGAGCPGLAPRLAGVTSARQRSWGWSRCQPGSEGVLGSKPGSPEVT